MAHHHSNYLDMVKAIGKLPSMFTEEFGFEMYKYNKLVDRYGNEFEVFAEKHNGTMYFTHGWPEIRKCYVDAEGRGKVTLPHCHDTENFTRNFIIILTESDVTSGFL
ncbi:hypothetical protein A2U01_0028475, partial [Trifolium medium]|nr:hypothetical protein [Trifolium medium]